MVRDAGFHLEMRYKMIMKMIRPEYMTEQHIKFLDVIYFYSQNNMNAIDAHAVRFLKYIFPELDNIQATIILKEWKKAYE